MEENIFSKNSKNELKKMFGKSLFMVGFCSLIFEGNYRMLNPSFDVYSLDSIGYLVIDQRGLGYSFIDTGYDCYINSKFNDTNKFEVSSLGTYGRYMFDYYFEKNFGRDSNSNYLRLSKNSCRDLITNQDKVESDIPINL